MVRPGATPNTPAQARAKRPRGSLLRGTSPSSLGGRWARPAPRRRAEGPRYRARRSWPGPSEVAVRLFVAKFDPAGSFAMRVPRRGAGRCGVPWRRLALPTGRVLSRRRGAAGGPATARLLPACVLRAAPSGAEGGRHVARRLHDRTPFHIRSARRWLFGCSLRRAEPVDGSEVWRLACSFRRATATALFSQGLIASAITCAAKVRSCSQHGVWDHQPCAQPGDSEVSTGLFASLIVLVNSTLFLAGRWMQHVRTEETGQRVAFCPTSLSISAD